MTPQEIENTLNNMLAIQKELQETQIKQGQDIDKLIRLGEQLIRLNIDRVTAEMTIEERLANLAIRVEELENK